MKLSAFVIALAGLFAVAFIAAKFSELVMVRMRKEITNKITDAINPLEGMLGKFVLVPSLKAAFILPFVIVYAIIVTELLKTLEP